MLRFGTQGSCRVVRRMKLEDSDDERDLFSRHDEYDQWDSEDRNRSKYWDSSDEDERGYRNRTSEREYRSLWNISDPVKATSSARDKKQKSVTPLKAFLPHVFDIRCFKKSSLNVDTIDFGLLDNFSRAFHESCEPSYKSLFSGITATLSSSVKAQNFLIQCNYAQLSEIMGGLRDQTLFLYLRHQNAALMITSKKSEGKTVTCVEETEIKLELSEEEQKEKIKERLPSCEDLTFPSNVKKEAEESGCPPDEVILSSFQASIPRESVTSAPGPLSLIVPQQSVIVPNSGLLRSSALAEQLCVLHSTSFSCAMEKGEKANNTFEVSDPSNSSPVVVKEWLTALLCSPDSNESPDFPRILKKVKDRVIKNKSGDALRRSGMWFTLKASLHLIFVQEFDSAVGTACYKTSILLAMNNILKKLVEKEEVLKRQDILMQMLSKMARRIVKLKKTLDSVKEKNVKVHEWITGFLASLKVTMRLTKELLVNQWKEYSSKDENKVRRMLVSGSKQEKDIRHPTEKLEKYVALTKKELLPTKSSNASGRGDDAAAKAINNCIPQLSSSLRKGRMSDLASRLKDLTVAESCIRNYRLSSEAKLEEMREFILEYSTAAVSAYENDPLGTSRMLLTILKCLYELDRFTVELYPLLKEHKSGMEFSVFSKLLLPLREDMKLAHEIEIYFRNREANADYDSFLKEIEGNVFDLKSIGVRYASANSEMQQTLKQILEKAEIEIVAKKKEVENAVKAYRILETEYNSISCTKEWKEVKKYNRYTRAHYMEFCWVHHKNECKKCLLERKMERLCKSVSRYERPLPRSKIFQQAVVFELMIPFAMACLRDCMALWRSEIIKDVAFNQKGSYKWKSYGPIQEYITNKARLVILKSSCVTSLQQKDLSVNPSILTSTVDSDFILNNGYNLVSTVEPKMGKYSKFCVKKRTRFEIEEEEYKSLQWTLNGSSHSTNDVLAKQNECHQKLSLPEFRRFGSVRAGHEIQYRNLFLGLNFESGELQLRSESVFQLTCQAIWESGPTRSSSDIKEIRDSHEDLVEPKFALEFLKLLKKLSISNKTNWTEPYTLLTVCAITTRILELTSSPEVTSEALGLLHSVRRICSDWISEIHKSLEEQFVSKGESGSKSKMKSRLLDAALAVGLTFDVSSDHVNQILQQKENLTHWLTAVTILYDEGFSEFTSKQRKLTTLRCILLKSLITLGIRIEDKIVGSVEKKKDVLRNHVESRWKSCQPNQKLEWSLSRTVFGCKGVQSVDGTSHEVTVDVIGGAFLVDCFPLGRLPLQILSSRTYQRVFFGADFVVQPNNGGVYTTLGEFKGRSYTFSVRTVGFSKQTPVVVLVIREHCTSEVLELIPKSLLSKIVAPYFIQNFSHWFHRQTNEVFFREKTFTHVKFCADSQFVLDLNDKTLTETFSARRQLVSLQSTTQQMLAKPFTPIQPMEGIHVWRNHKKRSFEVELRDLGLKFFLEDSCSLIKSFEYEGYVVCLRQSVGTLVGLRNKLVLEKPADFECLESLKQVIIPHGSFAVKESKPHQSVEVNLSSLSNPKFFLFELDPFLRILKGGKSRSAWLYLAALHGATSASVPDIFTGITGTEMALDILQSPRVWSCQPYDEECDHSLEVIQQFSPQRSFYPHKSQLMEDVQWPSGLPSSAAHEGYSIIVEKLRADAGQLEVVHGKSSSSQAQRSKWATAAVLRNKAYWMHQATYGNPLTHLRSDFLGSNSKPPNTQAHSSTGLGSRTNARIMSHLIRTGRFYMNPYMPSSVRNLLLQSKPLKETSLSLEGFKLSTWLDGAKINVRDLWLRLYALAKEVKTNQMTSEWALLLGSIAHNAEFADVNHLHILQTVAQNPELFPEIPDSSLCYSTPTVYFDETLLVNVLRRRAKSVEFDIHSTELEEKPFEEICRLRKEAQTTHQALVERDLRTIVDIVKQRVIISECPTFISETIEFDQVKKAVEELLKEWTRNADLRQFISNVERTLLSLVARGTSLETLPSIVPYTPHQVLLMDSSQDFQVKLEFPLSSLSPAELEDTAKVCETIFSSGKFSSEEFCDCKASHPDNLEATECKEKNILELRRMQNSILEYLRRKLVPQETAEELEVGGLAWRFVPLELFPVLLGNSEGSDEFRAAVGALGVLLTLEQKMTRCLWQLSKRAVLEKELESLGHENWSPKERPRWLLLEVELGMMIRPVQVNIAELMSTAKSVDESCVTQLNMGEGKTCLIVPMLAVTFATSTQLCRVTVLKSLLETNLNSLRHTLGGLLRQRVFTLPCQRDNRNLDVNAAGVTRFLRSMQAKRAVLVTLREHRLSIQLKGYEAAFRGSSGTADLLHLQRWLDDNVKDVLDESDELLDAKYQLVYTMGGQAAVDGGDIRWKVAQRLLKLIPQRMRQLKKTLGEEVVEVEDATSTHVFPHCRILQASYFPHLVALLAEDFLKGRLTDNMPQLTETQMTLLRTFLTNVSPEGGEMSAEEHAAALDVFRQQQTHREVLLTLAGYLRYEVLLAGLSKRWKVNYGFTDKRKWNMAVPFRAKDVASERTEFGHPDMALFLTQLSFYYSGLSDAQLVAVFDRLKERHRNFNPEQLYASWIADIPEEERDVSVSNFASINLDNWEQRKFLFNMLRRTMRVIDFFLDSDVFPKESRVFQGKMTCTAWDLVSTSKRNATVGFSGTNDTQNLLPLKITQRDLPELQNTNRLLEEVLERPENSAYSSLPPTASPDLLGSSMSEFILRRLVEKKIPVLLDCGALMIELNNRAVADKWLEFRPELQGVVFFSEETNTLCVRTRGGGVANVDTPLELSPFKSSLDSVAVYLDDEHTRGTDLKFPPHFTACVTVGGGLTRDKLVQAAMRMRLLGRGHCVSFVASHEAHAKILQTTSSTAVTSTDVLRWVKSNSKEVEENGLIHWTTAALNFCRKRSGDVVNVENVDYATLGQICFEKEETELATMYGCLRQTNLFSALVPILFASHRQRILDLLASEELRQNVTAIFAPVEVGVVSRVVRLIPRKLHACQSLDEEQEKEIDVEVFEETIPERPGAATPKRHSLHSEIRGVFSAGILDEDRVAGSAHILRLPAGLRRTHLASLVDLQSSSWGSDVFVTNDFVETVGSASKEHVDEFLRPVNFVVSLRSAKDPQKSVFLVISPFEANATIGEFRKKSLRGILHLHLPKILPSLKGASPDDLRPLLLTPSLCVPPLAPQQLSSTVPPSLLLFCGDLYFNGEAAETAFATFLGFLLRQKRSPLQKEAFLRGWIAQNGFVLRSHRPTLLPPEEAAGGFGENPEGLVKEILRLRNAGCLVEEAHVVRLISTGRSSFHN